MTRLGNTRSIYVLAWCAILAGCFCMAGCVGGRALQPYTIDAGGNAQHGREVIEAYSCGACHTIPGVHNAKGLVGPPLLWMGRRTMIAGELPNNPENLVHWLRDPQSVEPGTAMPKLGLTEQEAHDAAAYLYTLR